MNKVLDWMKLWFGFLIMILFGLFIIRATWTTTNPGTTDSSLFINSSWVLTKDKWNALVNKVSVLSGYQSNVGLKYCSNWATSWICYDAQQAGWAWQNWARAINCIAPHSSIPEWFALKYTWTKWQTYDWLRYDCVNWTLLVWYSK